MERKTETKSRIPSFWPWQKKNRELEVIATPYDVYVVVVDDEEYFLKKTMGELNELTKARPEQKIGIASPNNSKEVFVQALTGNHGQQANIVLIDSVLEHHKDNWSYSGPSIRGWLKKLGMEFIKTETGRKVPEDIVDRFVGLLIETRADHLALSLRLAGYEGTICVLSNGKFDDLSRNYLNNFKEVVPDLLVREPVVDRVFKKEGFVSSGLITR